MLDFVMRLYIFIEYSHTTDPTQKKIIMYILTGIIYYVYNKKHPCTNLFYILCKITNKEYYL